MKIETIELINFECHVHAVLNLAPGLNAITGLSDHGKSSIRRAVEWVFFNRPNNTTMLRKKGVTRVRITLDDGNVIERFRSKSTNGYKINDDKPLTALRRAVPAEVQKMLNVTHTNIQQQREQYFLMELTSGKIARQLNEVTNLQISDEAIDMLSKQIRSQSVTLKATEQRIDYLSGAVAKLQWVTEAEDKLKRADAHEEIAADLRGKISAIHQTLDLIETATGDLRKFDYVSGAEEKLSALMDMLAEYEDLDSKASGLQSLIWTFSEAEKKIVALGDVEGRKKSLDKFLQHIELAEKHRAHNEQLTRHLSEITEYKTTVDKLTRIVNKEKELSTMCDSLREFSEQHSALRERILTIKVCRNFIGKLVPERAQDLVEQLDERLQGILDIKEKTLTLEKTSYKVTKAMEVAEAADAAFDRSEEAFNQFMSSIEICPLCGQTTGEETICDHE